MQRSSLTRALRGGIAALALIPMAGMTLAQGVADMPRDETLVLTPWGDQPAQFSNVENWNTYLVSIPKQRDVMQITINEMLFYTNLNTGELIPWQAESTRFRRTSDLDDPLARGRHLGGRQPFTSADVKFTLEALRDARPEIRGAASLNEWVDSVDTPDPMTVVINHPKPAPRFVERDLRLAMRTTTRSCPPSLGRPEHRRVHQLRSPMRLADGDRRLSIWSASTPTQMIFDRRDDWWGARPASAMPPAPERIVLTPRLRRRGDGSDA